MTWSENWKPFLNTKLPLNEDDNNFEKQLNYINYNKTFSKLHDDGWENVYFTSADVPILGYGCGVSRYNQFYDKDLYMYQVLPRPYLASFVGFPADKLIIKMGVRLGKSSRNFLSGNVLKPG